MRLPLAFSLSIVIVLVLACAFAAHADFQYVRSIPAPPSRCGAGHITGLDYEPVDSYLDLTVVCPDSVGMPTSYFYAIDCGNGYVYGSGAFIGSPPDCQGQGFHTTSCASQVSSGQQTHYFWVGDSCGCLTCFAWPGTGNIDTSDVLIHLSLRAAPKPVGLEVEPAIGLTPNLLYVADAANEWVLVYDIDDMAVLDTIPVPVQLGSSRSIRSLTLYRDHLFVASMVAGGDLSYPVILELTKAGLLLAAHNLLGRWVVPDGIAFVGDTLYVAGFPDSIAIYALADYETEVPAGDSVVVNVVPDEITVSFDTVSASGLIVASVETSDSCQVPAGVSLFPKFYELSTDAQFEYAAEVEVGTTQPLPEGVDVKNVRVFVRPSGPCVVFRDITTAPTEVPGLLFDPLNPLSALTRTISEDDEFSVFALGEDLRPPRAVVELKSSILQSTIDACADSIPSATLLRLNSLLDRGGDAYDRGLSLDAAVLVDSIAAIVRSTPQIPHIFDPAFAGRNMAGRLISDAHTLSFSLRFSAGEAMLAQAEIAPECVNFAHDGWVRAVIQVPSGLGSGVNPEKVFFMHSAQAVPDSVRTGDFDSDGSDEIVAVFRVADVKEALGGPGRAVGRLSCFVEGREVYADVEVSWLGVAAGTMGDGPYLAGSMIPVSWEGTECGRSSPVSLWFSPDGGVQWSLVREGIEGTSCTFEIPDIVTDMAVLKIACTNAGVAAEVLSDEFSIEQSAGVDGRNPDAEEVKAALSVKPNPSRSAFAIEFTPPGVGPVEVRIYSVKGELVSVLRPESAAGRTLVFNWYGDNLRGTAVSAGTYFVVACQGEERFTKKVVLRP